jgi:ATP dependent DNA ligase domain
MAEAFSGLPPETIVDGELCLIDPRGSAHFWRLMREMRTARPDESRLVFLAFDLLFERGIDLRGLPLSERKKDLRRLCAKAKVPFMRQVETFPDGKVLFDHCNQFGFEGVVSKRLSSKYVSGQSRAWSKSKCPRWRREHAERWRVFEQTEPGPAEGERALKKKTEELVRVREQLQHQDVRSGLPKELRKRVAILKAEIAELKGK